MSDRAEELSLLQPLYGSGGNGITIPMHGSISSQFVAGMGGMSGFAMSGMNMSSITASAGGSGSGNGSGSGSGAGGGSGSQNNSGGPPSRSGSTSPKAGPQRIDYTSLPHAPTYSNLGAPASLIPLPPPPILSKDGDSLSTLGVSGDVLKMAAGIGVVNGMDELQLYRTTLNNAAFESKQKARTALAKYLSGFWEGRSIRESDGPNGTTVSTVTEWTNCELVFNIIDGRITGSGQSVWQKENIPFIISGAFDRKMTHVHLIKTHVDPKYHTVTHYSLSLNTTAAIPRMEGTYKFGKLELKKMSPQPPPRAAGTGPGIPLGLPQTKSILASSSPFASAFPPASSTPTGSSATSAAAKAFAQAGSRESGSGSGGAVPPMIVIPTGGVNPVPPLGTVSPPPPIAITSVPVPPGASTATLAQMSAAIMKEFLFTLFGPKQGQSYLSMLEENEIDWDALSLMNEAHLKEIGFSMGPRVKIINSIGKWKPSASAAAGIQPNPANFANVPNTPTGSGGSGTSSAVSSPTGNTSSQTQSAADAAPAPTQPATILDTISSLSPKTNKKAEKAGAAAETTETAAPTKSAASAAPEKETAAAVEKAVKSPKSGKSPKAVGKGKDK